MYLVKGAANHSNNIVDVSGWYRKGDSCMWAEYYGVKCIHTFQFMQFERSKY